ncbi:hypothetical protein WJX82_001910 [Trebouxia sp. C0006]
MKPSLPPQAKHIKASMDSAAIAKPQEASIPPNRGGHVLGHGDGSLAASIGSQQLTPFIERLDAAAVVEGWHNNVLEHIGSVKQENVSGGGLLLATYILQGVSGLLPLQLMRSAEYMESLSRADVENLLESQPGLAQTLSKSISSDSHGDVALKVVEVAFSWLAYEMQEADGCGRFVAYLAMAVLTLLEMPGLQPPNYELLTTALPPVLRAAKRMAAGRAIYDCTACVTDRKPIEVVLMVIRRLAEVHQPAASLVCASGLTPFLVKLLSEDELTTKQALHLIDLQLREQVSFQDVHELYMLDYITSIPSPHLRTCQLLVGLNTAARLVQILKGTAGSAEPWVTDSAACVLAHIALHKQLHPNLTDAIPAVVAALCKEIDTEEQLCDGDVTCEYVCQPAVEFLAHMASQSANLIDIGLANGIEALARAVAVEPGKQRVTERSILALNLIASGGPSFGNAVARWRNVTNFRNQIDRYVAAQAPLTGPRLDAFVTAHQGPLAELDYENICRQAEVDFAADAGVAPSPPSAFVTCASSLTEGGQTSSHADDTRALMTAVLLGGISQDDLTEYMSCFGGLSQVLSNIGQVLRLHCGTIVCAPGGSGQEAAEQLPLAGRGSAQEAGDDSSAAAAAAATAAAAAKGDDGQHLQVNGGVPALKKRTGNNSTTRCGSKSGAKAKAQNGALNPSDADSEALNVLPTEEELLTCDCPFCVAYRGRSGAVRGTGIGPPACPGKAPVTGAVAGAKPVPALITAPLKDPLAQGFKATAVIGISCKATPVYRTNDPFTFKINDFKLPSDLVDDIVNKRYPACLAVLITESLELEGLWVPSASPNIKDKDGSDVLQFQRFRVFHPLPKQAHHGILKTLWDKRVQWNQGLNARRTKQLLQAFLDQDVRLGIPSRASASAQNPHASPVRSGTLDSSNTAHIPSPATTPVSKPMHQKKGQRAAASRKLALSSSPGQAETAPPAVTPRPDFTPLTPTSTQDQSDALHAIPGFDDVPLEAFQLQSGDLDHMPGDDLSDLPDLPPLHLSKAQHRSVRTDDGEEVHVLVSPVRSQGGDDSPSSPSRLPDSVLKAMCNMGKAFLSRFTSGPKSSARNPSDDGSMDSPTSASGQPTSPHWAPLDAGLSRSSAPNPYTSSHAHMPSARRSSSMRADSRNLDHAGLVQHSAPEQVAKDPLRPAQNGFKPNQRTGSLRPATRTAVKALPVGLHRNLRRPSRQDTARVQAVARNAAAQSVPPGVVDLIAAAQREIDAASASAEELIRENDFAEDGLDLDFDAFLESDGIAELVAQAQATAGPSPAVQHSPARSNAHARRARSPATLQASPAVTPARRDAAADTTASTPLSPARTGLPPLPAVAEEANAAPALSAAPTAPIAKTASVQPAASVASAVAGTAQLEAVGTGAPAATAAAGTPVATTAGTTAGAKELPKGNVKQKRAHKNADAIRARLKQRLEAAQEGVSTEDGSSSVTSGLDEDQALQADIMMRRLVQEEEDRQRREDERASKRLQKSAESAQAAATEAEEEGQLSSQPQQQPAVMPVLASTAEAAPLQQEEVVEQPSQQPQQQPQQQQAKLQAAAVPATKLTKAQRQRQKRLAKQALSVEHSALSAPGSLSDAQYSSPDDSAWETVTKKGNKGNKAASKVSAAPSAAPSAAAAAAPGLQTQTSGLSQSGRAPSGLLSGLASQQPGSVLTPAGTPSMQSRTPEGLHPEGSQSEESVASVHARSMSQDNESLMGTASTAEQKPAQQLTTGSRAIVEAGADAASVMPAAAQAAARPANWAGLLKSPQSQQQQQDWDEEELSASQAVAAIVSDDAFPQLGGAVNAGLDDPTPSHLSVSDNAMSFDTSQGPSRAPSQGQSQTPSESELHSVASSPFASGATARLEALTSEGSSMSGQESQDQIARQLHANAAIWGTGLTSGSLSGISGLQLPQQLPQQPQQQQQPKALYQRPVSAATPLVNNPWEPQVTPQQPPSSAPAPQAPAKPAAAAAPIKSVLPPNAQPFVPQARLSTPSQWQPVVPLQASLQHARQQQHQQAAAVSQQQGVPGTHAFLQGNSFGRGQQSTSMAPNPYLNSGLRPQQTHTMGLSQGSLLDPATNRGVEPSSSAALQQLQRQQQAQQQAQQQQHQGGGPSGSAFQQHQVPFSHQYPGLQQQQQQQQGRGGGFGGRVNGNHFAGSSMNGMANGHMSSTGTQSEDDELLSGVFNKVWEDNLQESQDFLGRQSPESSMGLSHMHAVPPKDIAAAWNLTPADMHKRHGLPMLVCPLTKQVMKDPVTAADGHTYERGAIVHWMHANGVSPVTHQPLHNKHLTPNIQIKIALNRMKQSERIH